MNTQLPKISIITPSFNQGQFIEQTIQSVLNQNYPNLEYIIIDGGSIDNTVKIIKKYEQYITYWVSESDRGQSHAINKGLAICTGDIINWLNSDDWLEPGALMKIAQAFMQQPNITAVSGFENHFNIDGTVDLYEGTFLDSEVCQTIERSRLAQPSTFFRGDVFKAIAPVTEDLHYIMDGELWVRYLIRYGQEGFKKIEMPLVNFRLHPDSKTVSNQKIDNFLIERCSIIIDLQRSIGLPERVVEFWQLNVFGSTEVKILNRNWEFKHQDIKNRLLYYFFKKYIIHKLTLSQCSDAIWALKQLQLNTKLDCFILKTYLKLVFKDPMGLFLK